MSRKRKGEAEVKAWRHLKPCPFCQTNTNPDWKDVQFLKKFIRRTGQHAGGLHTWKKTNCCERHQKMLAKAVANAKEMALLPHKIPTFRDL